MVACRAVISRVIDSLVTAAIDRPFITVSESSIVCGAIVLRARRALRLIPGQLSIGTYYLRMPYGKRHIRTGSIYGLWAPIRGSAYFLPRQSTEKKTDASWRFTTSSRWRSVARAGRGLRPRGSEYQNWPIQ